MCEHIHMCVCVFIRYMLYYIFTISTLVQDVNIALLKKVPVMITKIFKTVSTL